jgi:hypothetical protein
MRCRHKATTFNQEEWKREAAVGDVVELRSYRKSDRKLRPIARLEEELSLPSRLVAARRNAKHHALTAGRWPLQAARPDTSLPLVGIAIVALAILAYSIVALHLVGQSHYSARANLLPPVWSDD